MTSAAVYYHFSSKDDILLEGLRAFGEELLAESRRLQHAVAQGASLGDLVVGLLRWTQGRRDAACVYFLYSAGLSMAVESLRRGVRADLIAVLLRAVRAARPGLPAAQAAVVAAGLLALVDTTAAAWLARDETLQVLGEDGFLATTAELAERLA